MNNTQSFRIENFYQSLIISSIIFLTLLCVSCGQESQSSKNTESKLINKVKAVQRQMMVQGNMSEEEELALSSLCSLIPDNDGFNKYSPDDAILFKDVKNVPIYNGCEGLSEEGTKKCFNESIVKFIKQEFNSSIASALDISEPKQVAAFFVIDENGNLSGMKIQDAELTIQAEIGRILRKIPKIKPATQDGINLPVFCSILVTYGSEITIEFKYIPTH